MTANRATDWTVAARAAGWTPPADEAAAAKVLRQVHAILAPVPEHLGEACPGCQCEVEMAIEAIEDYLPDLKGTEA